MAELGSTGGNLDNILQYLLQRIEKSGIAEGGTGGVVLGLAVTEPLGICDHVTSAACGGLIGFTADIFSVVGHICVVKEWRTPTSFMKKFMVALVRTKNNDIAEALDETLNNKEEQNGE